MPAQQPLSLSQQFISPLFSLFVTNPHYFLTFLFQFSQLPQRIGNGNREWKQFVIHTSIIHGLVFLIREMWDMLISVIS